MAPLSTLENLARIASKPGVQSTLVLSRADGAIIRATGFATNGSNSPANEISIHQSVEPHTALPESADGKIEYARNRTQSSKTAEEVAKMIFQFVSTTTGLINDLEEGDDVQLLRLRTRNSEIVIVPDSAYIMVVVHDPPKAS
ncbi:hypothetical protein MMC26_002448 [Xylographa opegraphella]|nr:hypothetical protein [Xylographa opegraphella]